MASAVKFPGNYRHGNCLQAAGEHGDQGAGPLFAGARRQHQDGDVLIFLQKLADAFGQPALQDHQFRKNARQLVHRLGGFMEQGFGLGMGLVSHDLFHAPPLLEVGRRGCGTAR